MPARKANELTDLIKKLRTIRRQHELALNEIESTFKSFGIEHLLDASAKGKAKKPGRKPGRKPGKAAAAATASAAKPTGKRRGRKPGKAAAAATPGKRGPKPKGKPGRKPGAGKKTRATYAQTGDEFILSFVAKKGGATTNEIRQHWTKAGRKGKAENNLTGLVKGGKLARNPTPGQAGSTYTVPGGAAGGSSTPAA
jgi:hypothetical protein